jgi:hypothetical protein
MAHRMRGSSGIRGRASGQCIERRKTSKKVVSAPEAAGASPDYDAATGAWIETAGAEE